MSRGQRSSSNANAAATASGSAGASSQQQQSPQQQTPRRSNKTLGWYLSDKLAAPASNTAVVDDGTDSNSPSQMAPGRQQTTHQPRKGSLVEMATPNSSRSSPKIVTDDYKSHVKRHIQQQQQPNHRPRANSSAFSGKKQVSSGNTPAHPVQSGFNSNPKDLLANQVQTDNHGTPIPGNRVGKGMSTKEDYWYYDEVSDGFYYEHNGTRGWRKRKPEWGTVEQMKGIMMNEGTKSVTQQQQKKLLLPDQQKASVPSLLAVPPQQLNKFVQPGLAGTELIPPPTSAAPVNIKYYDPTTDGYYYEMASFDGWKRRQPPAEGVSPPSSLASSLGASQSLKGHFQQQQHQRQSSSPATATTGPAPHRKIQPLHYQAYQQPAPHLNPMELQEMILLAQQQQHLRNQQQQCCCPNQQQSAGGGFCPGSAPSACCCTSIAAMAAQLVLKQQQMMNNQYQRQQHNRDGTMTDSKSTDNIRSLLDNKPTKLFPANGFESKAEQTMPMKVNRSQPIAATNLNLPRNNKLKPLSTMPVMAKSLSEEKTTNATALSSGSFEEPYEFYWSGDEAGSEAPSNNKDSNNNQQLMNARNELFTAKQQNNTAASVCSMDDDGMEELVFGRTVDLLLDEKRATTIAPIGSETFATNNNFNGARAKLVDFNGSNGKKRPDTLKLACPNPLANPYVPISPGVIYNNDTTTAMNGGGTEQIAERDRTESPAVSYLPYQFNVDKFIADLPMPSFDQERMLLHSLRNPNSLRTPLAPNPRVATADPSTADSPLFTPIVMGRDPWAAYNQRRQAEENPWAYP